MSLITLERFDDTGASGYVDRSVGDDTVTLRLMRGREILTEARAELYRPDLVGKNLSKHPYCGFVLPISIDKMSDERVDVVLLDGSVVARGAETQQPAVNDFCITASEFLNLCDHPFYGTGGWAIQNGIMSISGVLLPPNGRYNDLECIGQDGVSFKFHWPIFQPDTHAFYWYYPGSPYLGFRLDIDLAASSDKSRSFEFYFKIKGEDARRGKLRNVSVPKDIRLFQELPEDFNVQRVQNQSTTVGATIAGYTDYRRIVELASRYITLRNGTRFLDWGCGFGRIARFFQSDFPASPVFGVELDDLNLDWMRAHLPHVTPIKTNLDAKIDVPDGCVDVIYGISVMTHIRESQQDAWLRELKRILAPGGVLMLTTCGAGSFSFSSRWVGREHLLAWNQRGFVEFETASSFDRDIGGGGYYIQAKQSLENTRRRWGQFAEIIDFIPSVFGYQDMVVMR